MRGIGTDIIEVDRIRSSMEKMRDAFLKYILTEQEIHYCKKYNDPAPHVAGRFAAKEAVAKALGTGFGESLSFHDIEIVNSETGQPLVTLSKQALEKFKDPTILISISHCKSHAVAFAIAS